jgi:hypothetical protein
MGRTIGFRRLPIPGQLLRLPHEAAVAIARIKRKTTVHNVTSARRLDPSELLQQLA